MNSLQVALSSLLICAILFVANTIINNNNNSSKHRNNHQHTAKHIEGTSGVAFAGHASRIYAKAVLFRNGIPKNPFFRAIQSPQKPSCTLYGVVTTIFEPSQCITGFIGMMKNDPSICLVIVFDEKTPLQPYNSLVANDRVVLLSISMQNKLFPQLSTSLSMNHFGRKNLGYLFVALQPQAQAIWDFDDDNCFTDAKPFWFSTPQSILISNTTLFNPYRMFQPSNPSIWPRGFPLDNIKSTSTHSEEILPAKPNTNHTVAVFQSLANHDPDVDAIYRMTQPLPVTFAPPSHINVVLDKFVFAPFNAQATLHLREAFFTLYLPVTVHGRVSDIWRSYFAQRLLWEQDHLVAFTSPYIVQVRNAHNYFKDFFAEDDLYKKSTALVNWLSVWTPPLYATTLAAKAEALYIEAYERDFLEEDDVVNFQIWLRILKDINSSLKL